MPAAITLISGAAFLACTAWAVYGFRHLGWRMITTALVCMVACYVVYVTSRPMTATSATMALLMVDIALFAVAVHWVMRLLGGLPVQAVTDEGGDDWRGPDGDDDPTPRPPDGGGGEARHWHDFDRVRRGWERTNAGPRRAGSARHGRPTRRRSRRPVDPLKPGSPRP